MHASEMHNRNWNVENPALWIFFLDFVFHGKRSRYLKYSQHFGSKHSDLKLKTKEVKNYLPPIA